MSKEGSAAENSGAEELQQANAFVDLDGKKILAVGSAATMFVALLAIAGHELHKDHASHRRAEEPGDNLQ